MHGFRRSRKRSERNLLSIHLSKFLSITVIIDIKGDHIKSMGNQYIDLTILRA